MHSVSSAQRHDATEGGREDRADCDDKGHSASLALIENDCQYLLVQRWPVTRSTNPTTRPMTATALANLPGVDRRGHDSTMSHPRKIAGISKKTPVQCQGIASPMIMKIPSMAGTSSRGRVFRKNSGVTLARSNDPRQPGEYAVFALLVLPAAPEFADFAEFGDRWVGLAWRWVGRLAG